VIAVDAEPQEISMSTAVISIEHLRKVYRSHGHDVVALDDVTLELREGETLALIGPSGSGKSTLLRCLNQLEEYDAGRVLFEGQDVGSHRRHELRTQIGMVFQDFNLFPHLTLEQNVMLAPRLVRHMRKPEARDLARSLLERVGIGDRAAHYPGQVSGGQQQRTAIARSLAMEPKVLLFDEPTSALDPETVGEVLDVMKDLVANGTTMIVATHEMSFAREAASTVCMMERGAVVELSRDPERFFSSPGSERTRTFLSRMLGADPGRRRPKESA